MKIKIVCSDEAVVVPPPESWTTEALRAFDPEALAARDYALSWCLGRPFQMRESGSRQGLLIGLHAIGSRSAAVVWTTAVDERKRFVRILLPNPVVPGDALDADVARRLRVNGAQVPFNQVTQYRREYARTL